jgi:hypothetical protein
MEAVCSVLIQEGVDEAPVVFIVTVEVVGTVAELETVLDDPATAETISMEGASRVGTVGIDEDGADVRDGAAAGAKDSCWPIASKKEPSLPVELSSKDPALV